MTWNGRAEGLRSEPPLVTRDARAVLCRDFVTEVSSHVQQPVDGDLWHLVVWCLVRGHDELDRENRLLQKVGVLQRHIQRITDADDVPPRVRETL